MKKLEAGIVCLVGRSAGMDTGMRTKHTWLQNRSNKIYVIPRILRVK